MNQKNENKRQFRVIEPPCFEHRVTHALRGRTPGTVSYFRSARSSERLYF